MLLQTSRRSFLQTAGLAIATVGIADCSNVLGQARNNSEGRWSRLDNWLKEPILDPSTTLRQLQKYTEDRVIEMPRFEQRAQWEQEAERIRKEVTENVVFRGVPDSWRQGDTHVEWIDSIEGGPGYRIRKVRYEALPGYWIPGLLYEPKKLVDKVPLVYHALGHFGKIGKAHPDVQAHCINMAKRGLLAFTADWPDIGQLSLPNRHARMHQLELCGVSGVAPFYLCVTRALDFLLNLPNVDQDRVAMTGLSGGGWQTIVVSALDTRIKLANPVAGYSSFRTRARYGTDLGDGEQSPPDMATIADYTLLTALVAPRPLLLTYNAKDDCCFKTAHALPPLLAAAQPVYDLLGKTDNLRSHNDLDPGPEPKGHNYGAENREAFYAMVKDFFFPQADFHPHDLPYRDELKTFEQLLVPLPESNQGFNRLARKAVGELPKTPAAPADPNSLKQWQQARRKSLAEIIRAKRFSVSAEQINSFRDGPSSAKFWKCQLDRDWTVACVELYGENANGTTLLIADGGRAEAVGHVTELLEQNQRVLAVDPFNFGELRIAKRGALFCLQLAAVGDRALGLAASQLTAIARWAHNKQKWGPISLVAIGPRSSLLATIATALEENAVSSLRLERAHATLKELIERDCVLTDAPEQFCFGLLEAFDVPQLRSLVAPRPIVIKN